MHVRLSEIRVALGNEREATDISCMPQPRGLTRLCDGRTRENGDDEDCRLCFADAAVGNPALQISHKRFRTLLYCRSDPSDS